MIPSRFFRLAALLLFALVLSAVWPQAAEAQRRRPSHPVAVRSYVFVGGYAYPRYVVYDPWYRYYGHPYGPQWGPYPYPYGYAVREDLTSSLRLDVEPREAEVFVDGYAAGKVDDYDGIFQRLRLRPGTHEIVLYLDGYRTVRQNLYLNPGSDQKVAYTLEPLGSGERAELPQAPSADSIDDDRAASGRPAGLADPRPVPRSESTSLFGTLSIRVQPADAELFLDGERWDAPAGGGRLAIRLAEGRHHLEVRRSGFTTYSEIVLVRAGETVTLNVALTSR